MKKVLFSLITMVLVVGLVGAGAFAYFSDTETSTGNSFTAGTLDINVDISGAGPEGKVAVTRGVDGANDSVVFANLAPGDSGSIVWTIKNTGSLPGSVMIHRTVTNDVDGVNTEPELLVDTDMTKGELDDNMWLESYSTIDGTSTFANPPYSGCMSLESTYGPNQFDSLPQTLPAGSTLVVTYDWSISPDVGNIIQGDTFTLNFDTITLDQIPS